MIHCVQWEYPFYHRRTGVVLGGAFHRLFRSIYQHNLNRGLTGAQNFRAEHMKLLGLNQWTVASLTP